MVVLPAVVPGSSSFDYPHEEMALCISKYPVSNRQYRRFWEGKNRHGRGTVDEPIGESYIEDEWGGPFYPWRDDEFCQPDQPVVCIDYREALSYASWVNVVANVLRRGETNDSILQFLDEDFTQVFLRSPAEITWGHTRLPTVDEWDFAAFGTVYPSRNPASWLGKAQITHHKASAPAPVDNNGERTNSWGLSDMFGNVWEWCLTDEEIDLYRRPRRTVGREWSPDIRGGSFLDDLCEVEPFLNSRMMVYGGDTKHSDLGFRLAAEVNVQSLPEEVQAKLAVWIPSMRKLGRPGYRRFRDHRTGLR
jgi:formylglycine-generating enzyme required for sulfatase activity